MTSHNRKAPPKRGLLLVTFLSALLAGRIDLLAQENADTDEEDECQAIDDKVAKADTFHKNLLDHFDIQAQHRGATPEV